MTGAAVLTAVVSLGNIYLPSDALDVENTYTKPGMRSNMADT